MCALSTPKWGERATGLQNLPRLPFLLFAQEGIGPVKTGVAAALAVGNFSENWIKNSLQLRAISL